MEISYSYIPEKLKEHIDITILNDAYAPFECEYITEDLIDKLIEAKKLGKKVSNHSNSTIIHAMGLSDNYNPYEPCTYYVEGAGPDIDTDFSPSGRDQLVLKLQEKFGYDNVARVSSIKPWAMKESIVAFTKVQGGSHTDGRKISDMIPEGEYGKHYTWQGKEGRIGLKDLPEMGPIIKKYNEVFKPAAYMDDQPKINSVHACAVIISPEPLWHQIPTRIDLSKKASEKGTDKFLITQYEGAELEKMGFIKFDLLVLDTLDILAETCKLIGKNYYEYLEKEIPLNDPKAFKVINDGLTAGLFQLEEGHVLPIIQKCKPSKIDHISDISALIRPGPKNAGLTNAYVAYQQTGDMQNNLTPKLDKVLSETGGVMVYQEQVMAALRILAGMDLATADQVRRAMGKKKKDLMDKYKQVFSEGYINKHNASEYQATKVWNSIETFADYGFNKAHSIAYALLTYYGAYLKAYHPVEYMTALMRSRVTKPKFLKRYITEAKRMGIVMSPPNINTSESTFTPGKNEISIGFNSLVGIGDTVANQIREIRAEAPFKDIYDFMTRTGVNKKALEVLAMAGAFDSLGYEREDLVSKATDIVDFLSNTKNYYERKEAAAIRENEISEWEILIEDWNNRKKKNLIVKLEEPFIDENGKKQVWSEPRPPKPRELSVPDKPVKPELKSVGKVKKITPKMVQWEGQVCGLFISRHPLDFITPPSNIRYNRIADISSTENKKGSLLVAVSAIETRAIKSGPQRGQKMATITIEDQEDIAEMTLFAGPYEKLKDKLEVGSILYFDYKLDEIITGDYNEDDDEQNEEELTRKIKVLPKGEILFV